MHDIRRNEKTKVLFIERKSQGFFSLEKVFRQIERKLPPERFETSFQQAPFHSSVTGIFKNLLSFTPREADIYHVTGDINYLALILPPEKTVLTIHDLSILNYRKGLRRWILRKLLFELPARRSRYLTAISQATKDELVRQTGCEPEKIRLIENPLDESLKRAEKPGFNSDCPNILQVGTLPYKNVPNLIQAITGLKCTLTIVGDLDSDTRKLLHEADISYRNESALGSEAMSEKYREADIVTFCSVFEGFGLPIIEAQAMRTPVITSDIEPMKSVAGDGALLVDPRDPADIRAAIDSLIADASLRADLVQRGARNVKRFDPTVITESYIELYTEVTNS